MAESKSTDLAAIVRREIDQAWNDYNVEQVAACFSEQATITFETPVPGQPARYRGRPEIQALVTSLVQGVHLESRDFHQQGSHLSWTSRLSSDAFRAMGVETTEAHLEAVFQGSRIENLVIRFTPDTVAKLRAAADSL